MTKTDSKRLGRIYQMVNMMTNEKYVGATFSPLHKRLYDRRKYYKQWLRGKFDSDRKLFQNIYNYGWECFRMELLEEVEVENKQELFKIEGDWIRKLDTFKNGLNSTGYSKEELQERRKTYKEKNKDKIAQQNKKYREKNKEKIQQKNKICREKNKETIQQKKKIYSQNNKNVINNWKKQNKNKYQCDICHFSSHNKSNYNIHLKSKKHIQKLKNQ